MQHLSLKLAKIWDTTTNTCTGTLQGMHPPLFCLKETENILNGQMKSQLPPESTICALPKILFTWAGPEFSRCFLFANAETIVN